MQDREKIQKHLAAIEDLQSHGEYGKCYERAKYLLALCERQSVDRDVRCRALTQAARSAYYVGRFTECTSLLSAVEALLQEAATEWEYPFRFECAVIRANVLRREGKPREALAALEPFKDADAPKCRPSLLPERLLAEGACLFYLNDLRRAEERLEAALGFATHYSDSTARARVLIMLGLVAQVKGLHEAALEYFSRAKDICAANADYYGEAAAGLDMGILLARGGHFTAAEKSIERARMVFGRIEWRLGVCRCLLALGNISKCRREYVSALRLYRDADSIAQSNGFAREKALVREYIGDVHGERGRYRAAEKCLREGARLAQSIAPVGDIAVEIDRRLGELLLARGEQAVALPLLRRALRNAQKLGDKLEKGAVLRCMGRAAFDRRAYTQGMALFRRALMTLREAGCDFELGKTHVALAEILFDGVRAQRGVAPGETSREGELLDEAWTSAVEATHIFGNMGVDSWKATAERCLDKVTARRGPRFQGDTVPHGKGHIVKIAYAPEYVLHEGFVAASAPMLALWEQSRFAATFDKPVLITGETGTGKELVARLIHSLSDRARRPFVALNCAAVPDHLFESEFFGHRRGSFTGATMDRVGFFEEANGGTLFLDEVGELTPLQQVKLLRVLQEGKIRRVGENVERPVDVRIISATNQDLEEKLGKAVLREDFYYRINAEHVRVPALRERGEDIVPLMAFFLCAKAGNGRSVVTIELSALQCLQRHPWPGNVRELFAVLERVKHMSNGNAITLEMLPERIRLSHRAAETLAMEGRQRSTADTRYRLRKALDACGGNKSAAARWLGISRGKLYKELRRSGLLNRTSNLASSLGVSPPAVPPDNVPSA